MTITLPDAFPKWLVEAVAGYWPDCDEDALRREGDCWKTTGEGCRKLGTRHDDAATTEIAALHGYSADTKATRNIQLGDDLRNSGEYCDSMAEQCYKKANDCEFTKLQVIGTGIALLTTLTVDALMSAPGVVKAAEDRAAAEASWTATARRYYGNIKKVGLQCATKRKGLPLAKATAIGFALGAGTAAAVNAGAQYYQKEVLHHRDKIDWNMVEDAAIIGGVGGGVGARFASRFAPGINKFFGKIAGKSESNLARYGAHITSGLLIGGVGGLAGAVGGAGAGIIVTGHIPNAEELRTAVIQGLVGGFVGSATIFTRPLPPGMRVRPNPESSNSTTSTTSPSTTPPGALRDGDVPRDGYVPGTAPPATPPSPRPATPPDGQVPRDGYVPRTTPPPGGITPPGGPGPHTGTPPPTTTPPGGSGPHPPGTTTGPHPGGTDPGSGGPPRRTPDNPRPEDPFTPERRPDDPATPARPPRTDEPEAASPPRPDNDRGIPPREPSEGAPTPERTQGAREPAEPQPTQRPHPEATTPPGHDAQVRPPHAPNEEPTAQPDHTQGEDHSAPKSTPDEPPTNPTEPEGIDSGADNALPHIKRLNDALAHQRPIDLPLPDELPPPPRQDGTEPDPAVSLYQRHSGQDDPANVPDVVEGMHAVMNDWTSPNQAASAVHLGRALFEAHVYLGPGGEILAAKTGAVGDRVLRVEVSRPDTPATPSGQARTEIPPHERSLIEQKLQAFAHRYGIEEGPDGQKTYWFEIDEAGPAFNPRALEEGHGIRPEETTPPGRDKHVPPTHAPDEEAAPPPERTTGEREPAEPQPSQRPHPEETGDRRVWPPHGADEEAAPPPERTPGERDPGDPQHKVPPHAEETAPPTEEPKPEQQHPHGEEETAPPHHPQREGDPVDPHQAVPPHANENTPDALYGGIPEPRPHATDPTDPFPPEHLAAPNRDLAFDEYEHYPNQLSPDDINRIVNEHPGIFERPRTMDELHQLLPPETRFGDLLDIRNLSYRQNGIDPPPSLSRENLEGFLRRVWDNRINIGHENNIYSMYARSSVPNHFSDPESYMRSLAQILTERPAGLQQAVVQSGGPRRLTADNVGECDPTAVSFVHYHRAAETRIDPDDVNGRIYINPRADAAPALMRQIVHEIVDDPQNFPGVYAAKVEGPGFARDDGLVIYTDGDTANERIAVWLDNYHAQHPDALMWSVPAMTNQIISGVGYGAEPAPGMNGVSFGKVRAVPIFEALRATQAEAGSFAEFRANALRELDRVGVDPRRPHRNHW